MKNLFDLKLEFKIETDNWPYVPSETRKYEVIDAYAPNPVEESDIIWKKLRTDKAYSTITNTYRPVKCPASCVCFKPSQFGSFSLELQTWNSKCLNRASMFVYFDVQLDRIECEEHEDTTEKCVNQSISQGKFKQIGKDVEVC